MSNTTYGAKECCNISENAAPVAMTDRMNCDPNYRMECRALLNENSDVDDDCMHNESRTINRQHQFYKQILAAPLWIATFLLLKVLTLAILAVESFNMFLQRRSAAFYVQIYHAEGNLLHEAGFLAAATISKLSLCLVAASVFILNVAQKGTQSLCQRMKQIVN